MQCLGVCGGSVQSVPEVGEEGIAPPPKSCLDVRIREALSMEKVASRDTNRVRCPTLNGLVVGLELKNYPCGGL